MSSINDITQHLLLEGSSLSPKTLRLSPSSIKVSWNIPANPLAYTGVLITASPTEINPSNFPTNGVRYISSSVYSTQADKIGQASVVGAFYDDITTKELTITDIQLNQPLYISVHLITSVQTYYQHGVRAYVSDDNTEAYAGSIVEFEGPPISPFIGQTYYDVTQKMAFTWNGITWVKVTAHTVITGDTDPIAPFTGLPNGYPVIGSFFYNTRIKILKSWNGTSWVVSESSKGEPTYTKNRIGTTGEVSAREKIKGIIKAQLGYPKICVELSETHFDIALNNALQELRRRTDSAYYKQYFFMTLIPGQEVYYLNDPTKGLDSVVDVIKIHRVSTFGIENYGPNSLYAQQFLNQFYAPGVGFDIVSVYMMAQMAELYSMVFAGDISYNWREATRELRPYRRVHSMEKVLVETVCEKPEQELLQDRFTQQWLQDWTMAEAMHMLAMIRGKYSSLPGPGGGLNLNYDMMISESQRLQEKCLQEIRDFEVGQNGSDNFFSGIVIG